MLSEDVLKEFIFDCRLRKPSQTALLKALYLAMFEATEEWTMPVRNWGKIYGELTIMYENRLQDQQKSDNLPRAKCTPAKIPGALDMPSDFRL